MRGKHVHIILSTVAKSGKAYYRCRVCSKTWEDVPVSEVQEKCRYHNVSIFACEDLHFTGRRVVHA